MGKRAQRVTASKQNIAANGRRLWEAQQSKPKGKGKGKTVMMMSASDRMPFGIELDTSPSGVKRRLWPDA